MRAKSSRKTSFLLAIWLIMDACTSQRSAWAQPWMAAITKTRPPFWSATMEAETLEGALVPLRVTQSSLASITVLAT
jgi:hypothetical protein